MSRLAATTLLFSRAVCRAASALVLSGVKRGLTAPTGLYPKSSTFGDVTTTGLTPASIKSVPGPAKNGVAPCDVSIVQYPSAGMPVDPPGKSPSIGSIFGGVRESSDTGLFAAPCQETHASAAAAPSAHTVTVLQTEYRSIIVLCPFVSFRSLKEQERPPSLRGTAGQDWGAMIYSNVTPAYPYFKASPCPYPAYPPFEAFGSFATEPAGAAAGAFDPQFSMQPFG